VHWLCGMFWLCGGRKCCKWSRGGGEWVWGVWLHATCLLPAHRALLVGVGGSVSKAAV